MIAFNTVNSKFFVALAGLSANRHVLTWPRAAASVSDSPRLGSPEIMNLSADCPRLGSYQGYRIDIAIQPWLLFVLPIFPSRWYPTRHTWVKVFISWPRDPSKKVAELLSTCLARIRD